MGLDTSHDAFHAGYGTFNVLRGIVCTAVGMDHGVAMDWPDSFELWPPEWDEKINPGGAFPGGMSPQMRDAFAMGTFGPDDLPPDAAYVLLLHEDCDGVIPSFACGPLADRLEELVPLLPGAAVIYHAPKWAADVVDMVRTFVAGLRRAAAAGEDLVFA